ncbi:MAG: hypothetical protein NZ602_05170 [Thermoguttaceae bacterium]|nr:hypothetical protein [Thermoguttaceae bacterium]MDW8038307.1 hypothetical protein [Thermoguttaceae bacterium]
MGWQEAEERLAIRQWRSTQRPVNIYLYILPPYSPHLSSWASQAEAFGRK